MHGDVRSIIFCSLLALSNAFYIPGFSYKVYRDGERVPLFVNKVYSDHSELQYKYTDLPFVCPPTGRVQNGLTSGASLSLNLGEVLRGDRITASDYELIMGNDEEVQFLCTHTMDRADVERTKDLIHEGYLAEWIVDNLPGATSFQTTDKTRRYYGAGFKIGEEVLQGNKPTYFLNNHVTLVIRYNRPHGRDGRHGGKVIVGFEVFPRSIHSGNRTAAGLPKDVSQDSNGLELVIRSSSTGEIDESDNATISIPFSYSVYFREEEKLEWKNRWDMYFVAQGDSSTVHWLAIANSLIISGLLTVSVAVILARTVHGDIKAGLDTDKAKLSRAGRSRRLQDNLLSQIDDFETTADNSSDEEALEDTTGWKLLHGDVFRVPSHGGLLAPIIGSGIQLLFMATGLLILSCLGILNPSFRGGYISVGVGLFIAAGLFSGYFSSRLYRTFGSEEDGWKKNAFVTASLVPGLLFAITFFVNLFVWIQASSNAIPFGTLAALVALWLFVQLPLVYIGGHYGFNMAGAWTHPLKPNLIPRQVPIQSWYTQRLQTIILAGFVPFAVVFIELMFVFKSLWQDKSGYYYLFGFLAVVLIILVITVIEVTIVATYLQLCSENYHWWWQSFLVGGSSSVWIFLYIVWYYFAKLHITGFVSSLLFFCYGFLACAVYGLLTGTIGFLVAYAFVRRIYSAIKVE